MNFPEALRLICGRCKRDKGTCKTCSVFTHVEEDETEEHVERLLELMRSMTIKPVNNWFVGTIGNGYSFQAKVTEEDSAWGIDNGRIIKLFITKPPEGDSRGGEEIVSYERGWNLYPENYPEYEDLIDCLYEYFQNHLEEEV